MITLREWPGLIYRILTGMVCANVGSENNTRKLRIVTDSTT
jgi:hypothetical protein